MITQEAREDEKKKKQLTAEINISSFRRDASEKHFPQMQHMQPLWEMEILQAKILCSQRWWRCVCEYVCAYVCVSSAKNEQEDFKAAPEYSVDNRLRAKDLSNSSLENSNMRRVCVCVCARFVDATKCQRQRSADDTFASRVMRQIY